MTYYAVINKFDSYIIYSEVIQMPWNALYQATGDKVIYPFGVPENLHVKRIKHSV